MIKFRNLTEDEIECRVQSVQENGLILLLYKNARCDMNILDETVGAENWQREHYECKGNLFCRVGICCTAQIDMSGNEGDILSPSWVWKSDCGAESNTEKEKGEASDSFKRACVNWGIGRELYTSPFIWIPSVDSKGKDNYKGYTKNGKKISVMASGMGQPSIGIYSYELYTGYGVDAIIRVGTCGSYQADINLFDMLICTTASTDSNWSSQYGVNGTYSAGSDFELAVAAYEESKKANLNSKTGNILSADVFYDDDPNSWQKWAKLGVMGVEMESYALYCNAARLGKKALCLLTVTDHFIHKDRKATADERAFGLSRMIEVAIATAERFAK
jgi:purine-nucleoside phosphorylase